MEYKSKNKHRPYTINFINQNASVKKNTFEIYNNKQKENKKNLENLVPIKNFTYYHKISITDNKKDKEKEKDKDKDHATVDSLSDIRLPPLYIDLSYDNPLNK